MPRPFPHLPTLYSLAADFTGDGKPDVFSVNSTDRPLFSLYVNSTPA